MFPHHHNQLFLDIVFIDGEGKGWEGGVKHTISYGTCPGYCITPPRRKRNHWMFDLAKLNASACQSSRSRTLFLEWTLPLPSPDWAKGERNKIGGLWILEYGRAKTVSKAGGKNIVPLVTPVSKTHLPSIGMHKRRKTNLTCCHRYLCAQPQ